MTVRELAHQLLALPEHFQDVPVVFIEPYDTDPEEYEIATIYPADGCVVVSE